MDGIRRTACAFANDLSGTGSPGCIVIGLRDDGSCAGTPIDDDLLLRLGEVRRDGSMLPQPVIGVDKRIVDGCEVAVLTVHPHSSPPVRYRGRAYVRIGPSTRAASPEDELRLSERRRTATLSFDQQALPGATLDDLQLDYFRYTYLPSAIDSETLAENGRGIEHQLASLRLATPKGVPTIAGVLALGRDPERWVPGAYVQLVRFSGTELTDPIRDQKRISTSLGSLLSDLDDLMQLNITTATDITGGSVEVKSSDYPIDALRQLARNAVMHRSYASNAPVRINWFSDRVEIQNPGGLFGVVNERNFGTVTDYRNPVVAEIMRTLGYVQRFGVGVATAKRSLAFNGNPEPAFAFAPESVLVTVGARP
jgi:ATP-dependent DNA helicase RecG